VSERARDGPVPARCCVSFTSPPASIISCDRQRCKNNGRASVDSLRGVLLADPPARHKVGGSQPQLQEMLVKPRFYCRQSRPALLSRGDG
jgi:hypothetical protein